MITSACRILPLHLKSVSGAYSRVRSAMVMRNRATMHSNTHSLQSQKMEANMKTHDITIDEKEIQATNMQYEGTLEIKDSDFGKGLFALRDFHEGDLVMSATAKQVTSTKNSHTVQTSWKSHALMDLPASLINHKCSANVGVKDNLKDCFDWYAMTHIPKGEELFADYETFEYEIQGFKCSCGSPVCRGTLRGFGLHKEQVLKQYDGIYIASYLKE